MFLTPTLVNDCLIIFFAILIEALPFITLGVIVSGLLTVFIKDEWLLKLVPKNKFLGHIVIAFLGFIFPVCECGNVPVARRLIEKGLPVPQAITFLLAAPIINPVVILATYTAFQFAPEVVALRVGIAFMTAVTTGLIISLHKNPKELLTNDVCVACDHGSEFPVGFQNKMRTFFTTVRHEVLEMFQALILGAGIAALTTTFSRDAITSIAHSPLLATVAMMVLALIMSICSTVDAFVALGYVGKFPISSLVAFLVFGPMIDFRVMSMMRTTFKWKLILMITMLVSEMVLISSILLNFWGR